MKRLAICMALIYIALAAYGAYLAWQPVLNTLPKSMSFDQENLKKHDSGCPTAVYTVIDGELVQCPPYALKESHEETEPE